MGGWETSKTPVVTNRHGIGNKVFTDFDFWKSVLTQVPLVFDFPFFDNSGGGCMV